MTFGNLRKSMGVLRHPLIISGRLRDNFGYFRNTSDDLHKNLGFPAFPRTNLRNLRCNLHWCYTFCQSESSNFCMYVIIHRMVNVSLIN